MNGNYYQVRYVVARLNLKQQAFVRGQSYKLLANAGIKVYIDQYFDEKPRNY